MNDDPTDNSFMDFQCPYCGQPVSYPLACAETLQDCPSCSEVLIVPRENVKAAAKLPLPSRTPRLVLRRLLPRDAGDLLELMTDEEGLDLIGWKPLEEPEVEEWIERDRALRLTQEKGSLCLAIEVEDSKVIGFLSLCFADEERRQVTFTMMINPGYRRRGFGAEAVRGAMGFAFCGINAHRVVAYCDSRDAAAHGMLLKAGLRKEGEFVEDKLRDGQWRSTASYALLRREFEPPP